MKFLKRLLLVSILFLALSILSNKTFSVECQPGFTYSNKDELNQIVSSCQQKVTNLQQQASSLSSEIQLFDTKIYLTTLQIQETENKIQKTQEEIETLGGRINNLNSSLDHLSKVLLEKIVEGYKRREAPLFEIFLDSDNASVLFNRLKYAKKTEQNDQHVAFQLQQAKTNFEQQKNLREEKKTELDQLQQTLESQKVELNNQQASKQKLLIDTQNNEATYQRLLSQAKAQLAAFSSFVQTSGASSTIGANAFGNGSDGTYYSQRDERWASKAIGLSSENVLNVGCLVTSVAMVAKKYGQDSTPLDIAADTNRFWVNTAWMRLPWPGVAGRSYVGISTDQIDPELQSGNYVIVGVGGCANGGSHYVVLTKKDGGDYIMHDPIYGPDLKFSSHYSNICSAATFK